MRSRIGLIFQIIIVFLIVGTSSSKAQNDLRYSGPIIDMHLHAKSQISAKNRLCFPQPCTGEATIATHVEELKPMTLAAMKRNNIVLGLISGEELDNVLSWTKDNQDIFFTGIMVNRPSDIKVSTAYELLQSKRAQFLGEVGPAYYGIPIDDTSLDPFFAMAHELDVPVLVHMLGIGGDAYYNPKLGNPINLVPILLKYPGLRIFLENAGWPYLEEATTLMYQYPNVYADVSTILHLLPNQVALKYVKDLIDNGLGKRIMFGSDDMIWPEVIDENVELIQSAKFLSPTQKGDIFYNNAARFLRLSDEQITKHHKMSKATNKR